MKKIIALLVALTAIFALSACTESARYEDEKTSEAILQDLQKAHPVPKFKYSQYRQNLVEIVTAQADATPTTTFFFNQGVKDPVASCPSVGFPIPTTAQLTNPDQTAGSNGAVLPQVEPNGVFTGESTGTYVICRDANGRGYADYWEGFVKTVTGPAEWNGSEVVLIGAPTGTFTTGED
jgi:hypothetical protein